MRNAQIFPNYLKVRVKIYKYGNKYENYHRKFKNFFKLEQIA